MDVSSIGIDYKQERQRAALPSVNRALFGAAALGFILPGDYVDNPTEPVVSPYELFTTHEEKPLLLAHSLIMGCDAGFREGAETLAALCRVPCDQRALKLNLAAPVSYKDRFENWARCARDGARLVGALSNAVDSVSVFVVSSSAIRPARLLGVVPA
jgi:hypothetical protein